MRIATSLFATFLLAAGMAAHAADAPAGAVVEACKADVEKLCPGVQPGEGRIAQCLRGKHRQLSDGCKTALKEQRKKQKAGAA